MLLFISFESQVRFAAGSPLSGYPGRYINVPATFGPSATERSMELFLKIRNSFSVPYIQVIKSNVKIDIIPRF